MYLYVNHSVGWCENVIVLKIHSVKMASGVNKEFSFILGWMVFGSIHVV